MSNIRNEYPRPQFVREDWVNLNGEWNFSFDDGNKGLQEKWYHAFPKEKKIVVPFAYQTEKSGINDPSFHDVVWYHREFDFPEAWEGKELLLHFGAVDYRAWVYVNGELVTFHEGGNTPFHANITHALQSGGNDLVVRVEDPSTDETIPRGKQYWHEKPESIFYTRTTGIWQTVWMEPVDQTRLDYIRWTPHIDRGDIELEADFSEHNGEDVELEVTIKFDGNTIISERSKVFEKYLKRSYNLRNRFTDRSNIHHSGWYWTPESPNLFDVELKLVKDGKTTDKVDSYFGMRKVSIDDGEFRLNNKPYYQKLVLDQGYFPEALLTAPTDDDLKEDIVLAKKMGFNGARKHQKVEDPRYLYWADKLGFLVWGEMANAAEYSEDAVRRISSEWGEAVKRDYSHPCIVAWVPLNESWGISRVAHEKQQQHHSLGMYYLTKSLDTTRPVLSNEGWEHTISDICGVHNYRSADIMTDYFKDIESATVTTPADRPVYAEGFRYQGEPILVTEYGGIAYEIGEKGWGYSSVTSSEDLVEEYRKQTTALQQSPVLQGYCYTQLTDVEQEINGLLTYDRKPKCELNKIKAVNDQK
ncbi:glycoside hydrolase family 2 protein [Thalassobacillus pellis]|uniref:glycoside hydrolase family 2 protein n=1 Tax=Thalassobacillus pellis TaxID=748008 RepID=UPI00196147F8|nr:sugar-binding domain-containing protein [Thalassobacillus pellis]MBM7551461.1 beta-galactosidase/beta-glucuronidase [Thalassobacillus pellis]